MLEEVAQVPTGPEAGCWIPWSWSSKAGHSETGSTAASLLEGREQQVVGQVAMGGGVQPRTAWDLA